MKLPRFGVGGVAAELGWDEAFHSGFDSGIDKVVLRLLVGETDGGDDRVLAFEGFEEFCLWVCVGHGVDFVVGRKGGLGSFA